MRNFWFDDWSLASWQMGLWSSWRDKSVAQVEMRRHCDSAFECGIVWWIRQFHNKLLTTQPSFVSFLVTRAFNVGWCVILFQHSCHALDVNAFECCLHEFSVFFSWCQWETCNSQTIKVQPTTSCQLWQQNLRCLQTQTTFPQAHDADHSQHWWVNQWKKEPAKRTKLPQILPGATFA